MHLVRGHCGQSEERCELRCCLELWDRIELLERARERIREAPHRSRGELLKPWVEVLFVNAPGQVFRCVELALHKGLVDDELRTLVLKARSLPRLHLLPHRL